MVHKLNKTKKESATMDSNVKYLNPKADLTFKLVFGEHPDLVMSLLNALLPLADDEQITHVEYITPEMVPENPAKKNSVVDVRCFDQMGRQFIVEMQMEWNERFRFSIVEKSAFNDAQLYAYEQFWDAVYVERALIEGGYNKGRAEERIANAKALLDNGVPLEVIVKSLHLSDDEAATLSCP